MKRLSKSDVVAFLIVALFILGGLLAVVSPRELMIVHLTTGPLEKRRTSQELIEHVTPQRARIYGLAAVLFGSMLAGIWGYGVRNSAPEQFEEE